MVVTFISLVFFLFLFGNGSCWNVRPNKKYGRSSNISIIHEQEVANNCQCRNLCISLPHCIVASVEKVDDALQCKLSDYHVTLYELEPSINNSNVFYIDTDFELFGTRFYYKSNTILIFWKAQTFCLNEMDAQLVTMETIEKEKEVLQFLARTDLSQIWIGLIGLVYPPKWYFRNETTQPYQGDIIPIELRGIYYPYNYQKSSDGSWKFNSLKNGLYYKMPFLCIKY